MWKGFVSLKQKQWILLMLKIKVLSDSIKWKNSIKGLGDTVEKLFQNEKQNVKDRS